jgi:RNA polymerase sigma-70 factor (ECF subfamily)
MRTHMEKSRRPARQSHPHRADSERCELGRALVGSIPNLKAFALSLSGDTHRADDLVQETLLKAWRGSDSFEVETNLRAWLFTILRNTFFSEQRKARREITDTDGYYASHLATHPEQHGRADLYDFVRAIKLLPQNQRDALIMVGVDGYSYEDAARAAGCELGTIKSRVSRGRTRLKEAFGVDVPAEFGSDGPSDAVLSQLASRLRRC